MAKRFTDTALTRKAWFRKLPARLKCAWEYLRAECDAAGVWSVDMESMVFHIGDEVKLEELFTAFNCEGMERIQRVGQDKIYLPGFIAFQYGKLSHECKPHQAVISILESHCLWKVYAKGLQTLEDKDKEKDKEQDKDKDKETEKESEIEASRPLPRHLVEAYELYPRKEGRAKGLEKAKAQIKTFDDLGLLKLSIQNYSLKKSGTEQQYLMLFSTFMEREQWRDWLDPNNGTASSKLIMKDDLPDWRKSVLEEERLERENLNAKRKEKPHDDQSQNDA